MHENTLGLIGNYFNLKIQLKFNEISEVSFDVPSVVGGSKNELYDRITGFKIVQIDPYGKFILMNPKEKDDGIRKVKSCTAKSLEYEFSRSNIVLEEGTYCLYNPADPSNTIVGIVLDSMPGWGVGTVDSSLLGRYRTFSDTDQGMLTFLYGDAQKSYNCLFVFDSYSRTFDIVDADNENTILPIYLSLDNFISDLNQEELSARLFTVLSVYGADPVSINSVNPTGDNRIYNLDWFIENGDIEAPLAQRWCDWETLVKSRQDAYATLLMLRSGETSRKETEKAKLTDLEGELTSLSNLRDVIAKGIAEKLKDQSDLDEVNAQYKAKEREIADKKVLIESIEGVIANYTAQITNIANECKLKRYFAPEEFAILQNYFQEGNLTDDTFAVFEVDITGDSKAFYESGNCSISFSDAEITSVPLDSSYSRRLFSIKGGKVTIESVECKLTSNIIDGTFERKDSGETVASFYLGKGTVQGADFPSGTLTLVGSIPSFSTIGSSPAVFNDIDIYFTRNVTDYQTYSVEKELYEYAKEQISDIALPTFSFDIDCANIIFARESEPFKDALRLGSAIYLQINDNAVIKPLLLEISLNYEDPSDFELTFSNEYKRPDSVNTLKDIIKDAVNATRKLDMSQHQFNTFNSSGANTFVSNLITDGLDAAKQSIVAGKNQSVIIDGSGLRVTSPDDPMYIHMNDSMMAFIDRSTGDVKLGVGRFKDPNVNPTGTLYGIIAPNIIGTLIAGENLVIENKDINGQNMQFKVDASGAFLNNSRFYMQKDGGGKIAFDPQYGIAAGVNSLYQMNGTHVTPSFIDGNGNLIMENGMPKNTNFFLDLRNGNAYFHGTVYGTDGYFNGVVKASDFQDKQGNSMFTSDGRFKSDYLDVRGLNVNNNFIVDENGNVTIRNGSISWGAVTGTGEIDQRISSAQNAANNAQSTADSAQSAASSARSIARQIANGTYLGGTFIDGKTVAAPSIVGGTIEGVEIYGGGFYGLSGRGRLTLETKGNYSDLIYYGGKSGNWYELLKIYDGADGSAGLYFGGNDILHTSINKNTVSAVGTWNFSSANVEGISARFA